MAPAEAAPETAPSAEPELSALPRYQIRIPFSVEFSDSFELIVIPPQFFRRG